MHFLFLFLCFSEMIGLSKTPRKLCSDSSIGEFLLVGDTFCKMSKHFKCHLSGCKMFHDTPDGFAALKMSIGDDGGQDLTDDMSKRAVRIHNRQIILSCCPGESTCVKKEFSHNKVR